MDWLVTALSGSGFASIIGLAGGLVSKYTELKAKRLEYEFTIKNRQFDIKESELEHSHELSIADKKMERAEVEGEIRVEEESIKAFAVSQETGNNVVGFLRLVRPAITAYMLLGSTTLFIAVWLSVDGLSSFKPEDLNTLLRDMVDASLFLTIMCIGWWFGSRGGNTFGAKK